MPRLKNATYLKQRELLITWWGSDGGNYAKLPYQAQRDIHDFFAPTEPLSDGDAIRHRQAMTRAFPSLAHKAGRAFEALRAFEAHEPNLMIAREMKRSIGVSRRGKGAIRIETVANPNPDYRRLAELLIQHGISDNGLPQSRRK